MRWLTQAEIQFVKDTGFTPTVFQCDEWNKTIFTDEKLEYGDNYNERREAYSDKYFNIACDYAAEKYGIDLPVFINKNIGMELDDCDGISLEYVATYLLYCFFSLEELRNLTSEKAIEWLQNYRYFGGFRKWYGDCSCYINEAIRAHKGLIEFYETEDKNIWWRERYE